MLRKKMNSVEQIVGKVNYAPEKHSKESSDRDSKEKTECSTNTEIYVEIMTKHELDRGDSGKLIENVKKSRKVQLEKMKEDARKNEIANQTDVKNLTSQMKAKNIDKIKIAGQRSINMTTETATKKIIEKSFNDEPQHKTMNLEERKRLRDKYTFKLKSVNEATNLSSREEIKRTGPNERPQFIDKNADRFKKQSNQETAIQKGKAFFDSQLSDDKNRNDADTQSSRPTLKPKNDHPQLKESGKKEDFERKPIIKTITSRHDAKVFKAVTFTDHKKPAQLQINIPNNTPMKKLKLSKSSQSPSRIPRLVRSKTRVQAVPNWSRSCSKSRTTSKTSVKDKKRKNRKRRKTGSSPELYKSKSGVLSSPELSIAESHPLTEVAKWAPSSVSRHTQPYYEAWVNTTLAAISKEPGKELSDRKLMRSFEKAFLERSQSPELEYADMNDERYTGRIKITQR